MRGARSIYVDYVDYDEIAHHAGEHPDRVPGGADRSRPGARRPGEGRGAGSPALPLRAPERPRSVAGPAVRRAVGHRSLGPVRRPDPSETTGIEDSVEGWGRVDSVVEDLGWGRRRLGQCSRPRAGAGTQDGSRGQDGGDTAGRAGQRQPRAGLRARTRTADASRRSSSGGRSWSRAWSAHQGIGFVAALGVGRARRHRGEPAGTTWRPGVVEGEDPLDGFGAHAAGDAAARGLDARGARALRQQRHGPDHPRRGSLRAAGRLPRRSGRLAGPGLRDGASRPARRRRHPSWVATTCTSTSSGSCRCSGTAHSWRGARHDLVPHQQAAASPRRPPSSSSRGSRRPATSSARSSSRSP